MPRAPKGAAKTDQDGNANPFAGYVEPMDLTPEAAKAESPVEQAADAAEPVGVDAGKIMAAMKDGDPSADAGVDPVVPTDVDPGVIKVEAAGEAPATQETLPEPAAKPAPKKRTSRARPQAVQGAPDASLPGGTAKKATLEFGSLAEEKEFINALWYGPEGVGKTTAALRAADFGPVMVVNAEGGLKRRALEKQGINVENISVWPPAGQEELLTRAGLEELGHKLRDDLREDPDAWYAVVWDSGSAIGDRILRQVVAAEVAKDAAKPAHLRKETRADVFFTDRSDYGTMTSQFVPLVHQFRDLQCHFLVTALERRDVDEDTGQVMYGPVFTPAVSSEVRASADLVMRVSQEEAPEPHQGMVVVAATRPNPRYRGKDRFDATPIRFINPSFTRTLAYVEGELTEADDKAQIMMATAVAAAPKSGKINKRGAAPVAADTNQEN